MLAYLLFFIETWKLWNNSSFYLTRTIYIYNFFRRPQYYTDTSNKTILNSFFLEKSDKWIFQLHWKKMLILSNFAVCMTNSPCFPISSSRNYFSFLPAWNINKISKRIKRKDFYFYIQEPSYWVSCANFVLPPTKN